MLGLNKVMLIGRLGSDPELRSLPNGSKVVTLGVATSERYNDRNGVKQETTEWHNVELWDRLAEIAHQYLRKGSAVYIEGKIKTDTWQDQDGNNRKATKIRGLSMQMLDSRQQGDGAYQQAPAPNYQSQPAGPASQNGSVPSSPQNEPALPSPQNAQAAEPISDPDDELPF